MNALRVATAVFAKDLRAELRSRESLLSMVVFGLLVVVVFNFSFAPSPSEARRMAPGVLWLCFSFAGILGVNRSFHLEREAGALGALWLAPCDRGAIYLGKAAANALFLFVLEAIVVPVFALLNNLDLRPALPRLLPVLLLGALGLAATGTIFAAVSAGTRMREVMTPLLFLPSATPVLVGAAEGTGLALAGETAGYAQALRLLVGTTIVFVTASYLLFEFIMEE